MAYSGLKFIQVSFSEIQGSVQCFYWTDPEISRGHELPRYGNLAKDTPPDQMVWVLESNYKEFKHDQKSRSTILQGH